MALSIDFRTVSLSFSPAEIFISAGAIRPIAAKSGCLPISPIVSPTFPSCSLVLPSVGGTLFRISDKPVKALV